MKRLRNNLNNVLGRLFLLASLLAISPGVMADEFLQELGGFTAIVQGIDRIRFTLPTQYDGNQNEGIRNGTIYVSENGGSLKELLSWGMGSDYNILTSDKESGSIAINVKYDGEWQLVGKVKGGHKYFQKNTSVTFTVGPNDDNNDHFSTVVDWTVPRQLRGKQLTFHLWCRSEDISHSWFIPSGVEYCVNDRAKTYQMAEWDCPAAAEVSITLNDPLLAYDASQSGCILFPYTIQAKSVESATIYYTDAVTKELNCKKLSSKLVDMANLPANHRWEDIYIKADLKDSEGKPVTIQSEKTESNMLHFPKDLKTNVQPDGKVLLTWTVDHPELDDFDSSDNFEIQRNVNGTTDANDQGWTTIAMENQFVKGNGTYTYCDETLLDRYKNLPVAYRVRRSSTTLWKWNTGSGYVMRIVPPVLSLPSIIEGSVQRTDTWNDEEHQVKFYYTTGSKYDRQGRFIIRNDADYEEYRDLVLSGKLRPQHGVMVLSDENDWKKFAEIVKKGNSYLNAVMLTDIDLPDNKIHIGTYYRPYSGTFDGLGNTLTVNATDGINDKPSPFEYVSSATICNLTVAGTMTSSKKFVGGLVAYVMDYDSLTIENCIVSVDINLIGDGDTSSGGLIGFMEKSAKVDIRNSAFIGSIKGVGSHSNGGFIGVAQGSTTINMSNCLFAPSALPSNSKGCNTFARYDQSANVNVSNCYYTVVYGEANHGTSASAMTTAQLHAALGNDTWREVGNGVLPVMDTTVDDSYNITLWDKRAKLILQVKAQGGNGTETHEVDLSGNEDAIQKHEFTYDLTRKCVEYDFDLVIKRGTSPLKIAGTDANTLAKSVVKKDKGDLASYKFMNMNQITSVTPQKKQSSIKLEWIVSGGESDFYRLLRREHSNYSYAWTDTIATNLIQQSYEDKTVLAQQAYDYRVESILQCEGVHIASAEVMGAECEPTGRISGYVRMADGTAMAKIKVTSKPKDHISNAQSEYVTYTDEAGFYEFKGLPYNLNGKYEIHVGDGGYTGPNSEGLVIFSQNSNWTQNFNYFMDNYYVYSGNVYYRDTSIPVPGVSFKLDGNVMRDASQQVITTNNQGAFELSIPAGTHRVQAVKDGHYFANDGFLINKDAPEDQTKYNFKENVAGVYLWDSTTVVLRGRVVGGDVQGNMPLGESLSKNNLGDSIKIVMQLEGDNTSWLIRKQDDETVKSASYKIAFGLDQCDTTKVNVTRHTMTIMPDKKTGEYQIALHPAKYKVTEISAQGYATLFQQGKVGETVDLSFNVKGDTCEYNRIYHAVPTLDVKQFNAGDEPYFGVKKVTASDNIGNKSVINTWYWKKTSQTDSIGVYSLGYPVFMAGSPYGWMLQACEKYYYNNVNTEPDIVKLKGGQVNIKNGLIGSSDNQEVKLDEDGGASYVFTPQNTTFLLANDNALKSVSITLEYGESFYDIKPMNGDIFRGYVMATLPKAEGRKSIVSSKPILVDILRDPPGGGSSAYLEAGSKLSYTYNADLSGSAGVTFKLAQGNNANIYNGSVVIPSFGMSGTEAGTFMETSKKNVFSIDAITYYNQSWNFSYNFDTTERIQTLSGKKWVGGKADLFMGMTTDVMVADAIALRVVPDSIYQIYKTHEGGTFKATDGHGNTSNIKVLTGTAKVLVEGTDDTGKPVYLIRDEVMAIGPKLSSTFVHSQFYIENELLPDLIKERNALILPVGTTKEYAQALANKQKRSTYVSKVPESDVSFGYKDSYEIYDPDEGLHGDSIMTLNQTIEAWLYMLAENERQKLEVSESDLVKRYDFDGGASSIQYSETFTATRTENRSLRYPGINDLGQVTSGLLTALKTFVEAAKHWNEINGKNVDNKPEEVTDIDYFGDATAVEARAGGSYLSLEIAPAISLNFTDKSGISQTDSKKIGFTLSTSSKSSLTVDVYRTANEQSMRTTGADFGYITAYILNMLRQGKLGSNPTDYLGNSEKVYSSFVYRTRGGITCEPYEGERTTKWYQPGTVIDVATIAADKPRIWIDEAVVSNVPFDEPARFTLHMANETDYPEQASLIFNYYLLASSNPNGAKVLIDGTPMNSQGVNIIMFPCRDKNNEVTVFTKQIEVWAGKEFDYNDLTLCLYDPEDASRVFECKFSAHFIPTAGKVNVSSPSNKWVVNTESPYDGKRDAYYMPVRIDGFDTNYRGFDHIELQYKLSTQGDKDWVSVCSYYNDKELMAKASGVTDTIPGDGIIIARFYGEKDPIEQYYDLRAVSYCRHGNGFLTGMSPVLKGIKDTRLPVAFGTPEPTNGILGISDDIMIKFSEPIAGNYLSEINNFEILGTPNSNDISISTSLSFDGNAIAVTQGERNLTGKSFTVDVMLNPATDKREMTVFSHGGDEKGMRFGLTADRKLSATINGETVESDTIVPFNNTLHQVAYVLDQSGEKTTVKFYDGSKAIGIKPLKERYEGATSEILLGVDIDAKKELTYKGEMLEFRLWNRAMSAGNLDSYSSKKLTGYETGLLDYYPMNEGEGNWAYDKAPGSMDLLLSGTSWKRPNGISMAIKGDKGMRLKPDKFTRTKNHDFTLTFWFRTNDGNATLLSNGEAKYGQADQINIGIKDSVLYVRSQGFERKISAFVSEGSWHHFAMTVSRSQNVSNVYVDKMFVESFPADSVGGILGNDITLGATFVDKAHQTNVMNGHIDEVGMFSSVLPLNLIKEYSNHTPLGTMSALLAYLDFGRSEKQDDNTQRLEPTGISLKRYTDSQGKVLARRDTLVAQTEVETLADRKIYAPMVSNAQLSNLMYSYVANDNELYINIKQPDYMIEKTNIYVTVKEVPDLQGNLMASPITLNLYVYRNPLRWDVKRIDKDIEYGQGATFEATVKNLSGVQQNFRLTDLPLWITASQTQGVLDALDEQKITFTVSNYINIGTYNEQIALIGDNSMSEPLPITLRVRGDEPDWTVPDRLKKHNQTMMMVARVKIDGIVANSNEDILAVFDDKQQALGVAHIEVNDKANANEALAYLTIYGYNKNPDGSIPTLNFRFFDASSGNVYSVTPADGTTYNFQQDAIVGSDANPIVLQNSYNYVQTLKLKTGWNWVSFYVIPKKDATLGSFLNSMSKWEVDDAISAANGTKTANYICRANTDKDGNVYLKWDNEDEPFTVDPRQMYSIYSQSDKTIYLEGEFARRYIIVHKDWNRVGYNSTINMPISQALADYLEKAQEGDVVKSQDGFAIASQSATGLVWKGNLQYMEAGKGYMIKRQADNEVQFLYPLYFNDSRYSSTSERSTPRRSAVRTATTMNIVAAVKGFETEASDKLVVYGGAERLAEAVADEEQNYYLNIGSDKMDSENLNFVIERDGETIAMTGSRIAYAPNKVIGTPDEPTVINFTAIDQMPNDGKWYTVSGILIGKKPTQSGIYIHNGKAVFIK